MGTLIELADLILKDNIFKSAEKVLWPKCGTAIGTKFKPCYGILFIAGLEEKISEEAKYKSRV